MKPILWYLAGAVLIAALFFTLGAVLHPGFTPGNVIVTNANVRPAVLTNNIFITPDEVAQIRALALGITNTRFINDQKEYNIGVSFMFDYRLTSGKFIPFSYTEKYKFNYRENNNGPILGVGARFMPGEVSPAFHVGYHFDSLALIAEGVVATNWSGSVFVDWLFK